MTSYSTNGVLIGLHRHKAGQYLAIQKVSCILVLLFALVVIASVIYEGDGGQKTEDVFVVNRLLSSNVYGGSPLSSDFPTGYVGKIRIVKDNHNPVSPKDLSGSGQDSYLAPEGFEYPHQVQITFSTDYDFGLPDSSPLWRFAERGLPVGVVSETVELLACANLVTPAWPEHVWLHDDTAIVEGVLTLHSYGLMSFELISENYPGRGFDKAVENAVARGTCVPAVNGYGERETVSCRYRCLFIQDAQPSVSVGRSITAKIKRD